MNAATMRKIKARRRKEQEARLMAAKAKFFMFYLAAVAISAVLIWMGIIGV